jgi:hypothetical protein
MTIQSRIDSAETVLSTRATWLAAIQADRALQDKTKPLVVGLRQALLVAFAGQIGELADFGVTPRCTSSHPNSRSAQPFFEKVARHGGHLGGTSVAPRAVTWPRSNDVYRQARARLPRWILRHTLPR